MVASIAEATISTFPTFPKLPKLSKLSTLATFCYTPLHPVATVAHPLYLAFLSARYTPAKISTVPTIASEVILSSSTAHAVTIATIGLMYR